MATNQDHNSPRSGPDDPTDPDHDPQAAEDLEPEISKSQRKRDADRIRDLGAELAELGTAERATIPLPDEVQQAIEELNRTRAHGARKRQLGYLAKRLRVLDVAPIEQALENLRQTARANTLMHHQVERWRDRLTGAEDPQDTAQALTEFLDQYPDTDRQSLRQLQRRAITERIQGKPPAAARLLFRLLRDVIIRPDLPDSGSAE